MRLSYDYKGGRIATLQFHSPDDGGSGGGGGGSGGGATGTTEEIKTPFDDIALDELAPAEKAAIESGKIQFKETVKNQRILEGRLSQQEILTRRFQSQADRTQAEINRIFNHGATGETGPTEVSKVVRDSLESAGYNATDIQKLGPMFSTMLEKVGAINTKNIGESLKPMAAKVIENEATAAFEQARADAPMGIMDIPEVAEKVWTYVQERTKAGHQTTPEIVANLGKMVYVDHINAEKAAGREVVVPARETQPTPPVNQTRFTFPGASAVTRPAVPQSQSTQGGHLNTDTEAALATTFKSMTGGMNGTDGKQLMPTALKGKEGVARR